MKDIQTKTNNQNLSNQVKEKYISLLKNLYLIFKFNFKKQYITFTTIATIR